MNKILKKFQQISLFIYLNGLLIFDFLPIHQTKNYAKDFKRNNPIKLNTNTSEFKQKGIRNSFDFSIASYQKEVIDDL